MAVATGTQIRPELSAVDYSQFAQAAAQGAQMQAQSIAALGQSVAAGIDQYLKKKEEKQKEKEATTFLTTFINNNPEVASSLGVPLNLKGEVEDPGIVKAAIKTLGGADKALGVATSLRRFEQEKRMAELQMGRMERDAELDATRKELLGIELEAAKSAQEKRVQEAKNVRAATAAYGAVPQRVPEIVRDTISTYVTPTPKLEEFLYSSGAVTTSPVAIKVNPMPKDIQDFALRDPEDGSIIGIDRRTMSRFAAEQEQARAPILDEIAKLSSQAGPLSGVSRGPGAAFMGMGAGVSRPSAKVESQIKEAKSKLETIDKETQTVFSKIRDWESNRPSFKTSVESLPPSSLVQKAAKQVERTIERDASTDEKAAAFVSSYIKEGGTVTLDFIDKARDAFKTEMAVYDAGDGVMAVRVGNSAQIIDRGKPMNAAQVKVMKAEQYQKLLSGLAESSEWEMLPVELKKTISELASAHERGRNDMGVTMSGKEAFDQRRRELVGGASTAPVSAAGARPAVRPTTTSLAPGWSLVR